MSSSRLFRSLFCFLLSLGATDLMSQSNQGSVPSTAENICPLKPGMKVPDVSLADIHGKSVLLLSVLANKPSVIIFYRGGWCPYCSLQIASLQGIEKKLKEMGIQLLAISADKPTKLRESLAKHQLDYQLLSDSSMAASKAFGVAFKLDQPTVKRYRSHSMDLENASGETHHLLPVPSMFLIDPSGIIAFTYVNPDYRVRLDSETLIALSSSLVKN